MKHRKGIIRLNNLWVFKNEAHRDGFNLHETQNNLRSFIKKYKIHKKNRKGESHENRMETNRIKRGD